MEYKEFIPSGFDQHIEIDSDSDEESRENWLVLPTGRNRDSGNLDNVNFDCALEQLGGESDNVEVHRFGHWANGWFELIIIRPDSPQHTIAEDIEAALENYPVLDDGKLSELEYEDYLSEWSNSGCTDYVQALANAFELSDEAEDFLDDIDTDVMRKHYENLVNFPYEPRSDGGYLDLDTAVMDCGSIGDLMAPYAKDLKSQLRFKSLLTGTPDIMSPVFWDDRAGIELEEMEEMLAQ